MSVIYTKGNVLDAPAFGHGCNCRGFMGKGLALDVRRRFPEAFEAYRRRLCNTGLTLGSVVAVSTKGQWVFNLMTQENIGPCANLWALETAVSEAVFQCALVDVQELALPWIGCGIGGLSKAEAKEAIEAAASKKNDYLKTIGRYVQVVVYEPEET